MAVQEKEETSLRLDRREWTRLAGALGLSLALHLLGYGGYELGKKAGLWQAWHWPVWLQKHKTPAQLAKEKQAALPTEVPLMFVDVSSEQAVAEPPKDAKYYSSKNSRATNPDADQDSDIPKISGKQTDVIKTEDAQRSHVTPLQPNFQQAEHEQQAEEAKPRQAPGDLALMKPDTNLRPEKGAAEKPKPRTVTEAKSRQQNQIPGQKMKQDGGVKRRLEISGLDAKATLFGAYDAAFIAAITQHWYDLLDKYNYTFDRSGKVVVQFRLNYDGRITDMKLVESSVGQVHALICQRAVLEPAPYEHWPSDLRRMAGDSREVQFTFYY